MVEISSHSKRKDVAIVFGSQILDFNESFATDLRSVILENSTFSWISEALSDLRELWPQAADSVSLLQRYQGQAHLDTLANFIHHGHFPQSSQQLPSIILTPLVVATHLTQYLSLINSLFPQALLEQDLPLPVRVQTLGLCTGELSAAAVSSSANVSQLKVYGQVAIRVAMFIGAVIDAKDTQIDSERHWRSLSVGWSPVVNEELLTEMLAEYPESYISVLVDERRVTITTSRSSAPLLLEKLRQGGFVASEISLQGSFHHRQNILEADSLAKLFHTCADFQFPSDVTFSSRSKPAKYGTGSKARGISELIARSMLTDQSDWCEAFISLRESISSDTLIVSLGPERCIPQTLAREMGHRLLNLTDFKVSSDGLPAAFMFLKDSMDSGTHASSDERIAVVGMACRLPGANDLQEFWDALCKGKSQHTEVPEDRFGFDTAWREKDLQRKWYGNFISDPDAFDHKFFKKSPREMSSTDPQHRLMIQAAYQAVEQSGYFNAQDPNTHIGCYIGVGLVDYENNVAGYPATAYTATGNLKAFAAGKISHYFGWTGPGLTIDTACSSSAVAVHQACRAILTGECTAALAGGVNVMTSPEWFQNLAGASFLSPTGQCKPFDQDADGYCRGEGVGAVFLKKLSTAIEDGNQIFGIIASSGVYQNQNCTAITVPNALSLSDLFRTVTRKAGLMPKQISVVEAHGTGTQIGDPAEYDSIRNVFGGSTRDDQLYLGSVKGLVGHTESASGIVALIKMLLMVSKGMIPPQASFSQLNPELKALPSDNIEIARQLKPWQAGFRAALINNYGASGSNASLVVTQAPTSHPFTSKKNELQLKKHPFWLCGSDDRSLREYCARLSEFLHSTTSIPCLPTLSFQVSQQSNRTLSQALVFDCASIAELDETLKAYAKGHGSDGSVSLPQSKRPVVLCFGGQVSTFVGLDRGIYDNVSLLRENLNRCDDICMRLGLDSFYPGIFERTPQDDVVKLQTMLFATQYSSAKMWIACGVQVAATVGHSFGELTAMCISGVLSLESALKMIIGRSKLIQDCWGKDNGAMIAIEADLCVVERLITASEKADNDQGATVACFNGPRSFTVAGSTKSIDVLQEMLKNDASYSTVRSKRLNVTNSFHCSLVDPLMPGLEEVGKDLVLKAAVIPMERATEQHTEWSNNFDFVARHMRDPVYFNHAIQRLSLRYPSCAWLEAGSASGITNMVSKALGSPKSSHFQHVNISSDNALQSVTDATLNLWKAGINVTFWPHHSAHHDKQEPLLLPPYQFENHKHWLELRKPSKIIEVEVQEATPVEVPTGLWQFIGYKDPSAKTASFRINTTGEDYQSYVSAHIVADSVPICPSTLQLIIAIDAITSLEAQLQDAKVLPQLQGMENHSPLCMDESRSVWLEAERHSDSQMVWKWKITSTSNGGTTSDTILHVVGQIAFQICDDASYQNEFAKYERLVSRQRSQALLDGNTADGVIQGGRNIYKAFAENVQYNHEIYKGLDKIAGKNNESAGRVSKEHHENTFIDFGLFDAFCQVAGIYLNTMTEHADGDMYISDRIDQWIPAPTSGMEPPPETWEIYASHHWPSEKEVISDLFIFNSRTGRLLGVILGLHYVKVARKSMGKLLLRLSGSGHGRSEALAPKSSDGSSDATTIFASKPASQAAAAPQESGERASRSMPKTGAAPKQAQPDISGKVRGLICDLSGLDPEDIEPKSDLVELGIDSLMAMELAREIESIFKITLETQDLLDLTDFDSLVVCINRVLGGGSDSGLSSNGDETSSKKSEGTAETGDSDLSELEDELNRKPEVATTDAATGMSAAVVLETFAEAKRATDRFIEENRFGGYSNRVLPLSFELCIVHILDAFDDLGCSLRTAKSGQTLARIPYLPRHQQFVDLLYGLLEQARLVDLEADYITRTAIAAPKKAAKDLLDELLRKHPDHVYDHRLTYLTGAKLADCLSGKEDGLQLIFASAEGREIVSGMYGQSPINIAWIKQMEFFLERLFTKLSDRTEPIKILEMGAGTGGTTARLVPLLAKLGVPFEYTVTDLSASLVAGARKRFKQYPFMQFKVLDIEKTPSDDFKDSQHIVIATNCVHATHSLYKSTANIHEILRPDGFLFMLEMTETIPWIDLVFGLVEGWWLFDDGRKHALAPPATWERVLLSNGYGHVDWTQGALPESSIQRLIIAHASAHGLERVDTTPRPPSNNATDITARQVVIDDFIDKYSKDFPAPAACGLPGALSRDTCVLITGATGNLGSHLVEYFATQASVEKVICVNRCNNQPKELRQHRALVSRGIQLDEVSASKLRVLETDTSKPMLGLTASEYRELTQSVTTVIHNAWPMSLTRPINAYESQMKVMRNLIDLANACSGQHDRNGPPISFQFISSIATVGRNASVTGEASAMEQRMTAASVLPSGYGDAKLVCERLLDETLHKYSKHFCPMAVRIGQIAGSKKNGFWNPVEHLAFLLKSSQTLKVLPDLDGKLSWLPVNDVAATLGELALRGGEPHPIYHIENPTRQPWKEMILMLAGQLDVPLTSIVPFKTWIQRIRQFPSSNPDVENPAARLADFLDVNFEHMSCGDLVLDTTHSREHSETLRMAGKVDEELLSKYIRAWKEMGFLR